MRVHVWTLHGGATGRPQLEEYYGLRRTRHGVSIFQRAAPCARRKSVTEPGGVVHSLVVHDGGVNTDWPCISCRTGRRYRLVALPKTAVWMPRLHPAKKTGHNYPYVAFCDRAGVTRAPSQRWFLRAKSVHAHTGQIFACAYFHHDQTRAAVRTQVPASWNCFQNGFLWASFGANVHGHVSAV